MRKMSTILKYLGEKTSGSKARDLNLGLAAALAAGAGTGALSWMSTAALFNAAHNYDIEAIKLIGRKIENLASSPNQLRSNLGLASFGAIGGGLAGLGIYGTSNAAKALGNKFTSKPPETYLAKYLPKR